MYCTAAVLAGRFIRVVMVLITPEHYPTTPAHPDHAPSRWVPPKDESLQPRQPPLQPCLLFGHLGDGMDGIMGGGMGLFAPGPIRRASLH